MEIRTKRVIALVVTAGLAGLAITAWILLQREPRINDDDLKPARAALTEADNAFALIQQAGARVIWAGLTNAPQIAGLAEGNPRFPWDVALAEKLLTNNRSALEILDEVLARRGLEVPAPASVDDWHNGDYPWLNTLGCLGKLASIQAELLFREGREQEAFDVAFKAVELGRRIQAAGGETHHYLRGLSTKKLGLKRIRLMASRSTLPVETLLSYAKRLDQYRADTTALTNVVKTDYQLNARMVDDMVRGKLPGTNATDLATRLAMSSASPVLKPQTTKRLFAECARACLKSLPHPYARMPRNEVPNPKPLAKSNTLAVVLRRNLMGEMTYDIFHTSATAMLSRKCEENMMVAATQLTLALRGWSLRHGTLPESLTTLVPDYLAEVPRDDWDGEPLRYSPERRFIYSVGRDLVDDGGRSFAATYTNHTEILSPDFLMKPRKSYNEVFELGF